MWDPASRSGLPSSSGSKLLVGLASPGLLSIPIHVGSRARGQEHPNAKSPERELTPSSAVLYQEPPYQESNFSERPPEKQKSAAQRSRSQFSSKDLLRVCAHPDRSPQLHQLCHHLCTTSRPPDLMADLSLTSCYSGSSSLNAWLRISSGAKHLALPMVH